MILYECGKKKYLQYIFVIITILFTINEFFDITFLPLIHLVKYKVDRYIWIYPEYNNFKTDMACEKYNECCLNECT